MATAVKRHERVVGLSLQDSMQGFAIAKSSKHIHISCVD